MKRKIFSLALPLTLSGLTTPVLGIVDQAILGRTADPKQAMAVAAIAGPIFGYALWTFAFLRFGTTGRAARGYGAKDASSLSSTLTQSVGTGFLIGTLIFVGLRPFADRLVESAGVHGTLIDPTAEYMRVRLISIPCALMNYALIGWLVGVQRVRASLLADATRLAVQSCVGYTLVHHHGYGATGIAWGAVSAECAAFVVASGACVFTRRRLYEKWKQGGGSVPPPPRSTPSAWQTTLDLVVRTQCLLLAFFLFARDGSRLGDAVVSANGVLMNLYLLVGYPLSAFGHVSATLIGEARGARDLDLARRSLRETTQVSLVVASTTTAMLFLLTPLIIRAITSDSEVLAVVQKYSMYSAILPIVSALGLQFDGVAVGGGQTARLRNTFVLAAILALSFRVALQMRWLPPMDPNHAVWIAFVMFMCVRSVGFLATYRSVERGDGS